MIARDKFQNSLYFISQLREKAKILMIKILYFLLEITENILLHLLKRYCIPKRCSYIKYLKLFLKHTYFSRNFIKVIS